VRTHGCPWQNLDVFINLKDSKDEKFNADMKKTCTELKEKALKEVLEFVDGKL
jgi:formiminotetrahydrofolate cyclodeaminase